MRQSSTKAISLRIPDELYQQLEQKRKTTRVSLTATILDKLKREDSIERLASRVASANKSTHEQTRSQLFKTVAELSKANEELSREVTELRTDLKSLRSILLQMSKSLDRKLDEPTGISRRLKTLFKKAGDSDKKRNTKS